MCIYAMLSHYLEQNKPGKVKNNKFVLCVIFGVSLYKEKNASANYNDKNSWYKVVHLKANFFADCISGISGGLCKTNYAVR